MAHPSPQHHVGMLMGATVSAPCVPTAGHSPWDLAGTTASGGTLTSLLPMGEPLSSDGYSYERSGESPSTAGIKRPASSLGTSTTESKRLKRLEKNRESARECRRRKKENKEKLEARLSTLEEENLNLRLRLKVGDEAEDAENSEILEIKSRLDDMVSAGVGEGEISQTMDLLKERYADYGSAHTSAADFHLAQLSRLLLPTLTTRACMHAVLQAGIDSTSDAQDRPNPKAELDTRIGEAMEVPQVVGGVSPGEGANHSESAETPSNPHDSAHQGGEPRETAVEVGATEVDAGRDPSEEILGGVLKPGDGLAGAPLVETPAVAAAVEGIERKLMSVLADGGSAGSDGATDATLSESGILGVAAEAGLTSAAGGEAVLTDVWGSLVGVLEATDEQQTSLRGEAGAIADLARDLGDTTEIMERLKLLLADRSQTLDGEMAEIQRILTPTQTAKFVLWVSKNKACVHMLNQLWDKLHGEGSQVT